MYFHHGEQFQFFFHYLFIVDLFIRLFKFLFMFNRQIWALFFIKFSMCTFWNWYYFNTHQNIRVGIDNQRGLMSLES